MLCEQQYKQLFYGGTVKWGWAAICLTPHSPLLSPFLVSKLIRLQQWFHSLCPHSRQAFPTARTRHGMTSASLSSHHYFFASDLRNADPKWSQSLLRYKVWEFPEKNHSGATLLAGSETHLLHRQIHACTTQTQSRVSDRNGNRKRKRKWKTKNEKWKRKMNKEIRKTKNEKRKRKKQERKQHSSPGSPTPSTLWAFAGFLGVVYAQGSLPMPVSGDEEGHVVIAKDIRGSPLAPGLREPFAAE